MGVLDLKFDLDPQYCFVMIFGALVGLAELVSRYRDEPFRAVLNVAALLYIGLNIGAAVGALALIRVFELKFNLNPQTEPLKLLWVQALTAGFGSMVAFRSSIFVFRVGNQDVSVGPASVLQILLTAFDREVDRDRARKRAKSVLQTMDGVRFDQASAPLPTVAIALMQNLAREDQDRIVEKVKQLGANSSISDHTKSLALGLALIDAVGEKVLTEAVGLMKGDKSLLDAAQDLLTKGDKSLLDAAQDLLRKKQETL